MVDAGVDEVAIETFAHYYRLLEHGETGMVPEATIDPVDMPSLADVEVDPDVASEAIRHTGDHQAQRRPGHLDGHGARQVAALRAPRPVLPRHHRAPGAPPARAARRDAAADVHELLPHLRRHHGGAGALRRPRRRRAAAGVPAEQGAQAPRQGPLAGELSQGPRPRVVPAGPRRRLHRAARHRPARPAHRARLQARLHLQLRQPRRDGRPTGRRLVRRQRSAVRDRGRTSYPLRPQGRALRASQERRSDRAARDRPDAEGRRRGAGRPRPAPVLLDQQPLVRPRRDEARPSTCARGSSVSR